MLNKFKCFLLATIIISVSSIAKEPVQDPKISYLVNRIDKLNCDKFQGIIKKNCELTTKMLSTTYSEYCITTKCEESTIEDMIAWLDLKKAIIVNIKSNK
jgi:hypothetical protein